MNVLNSSRLFKRKFLVFLEVLIEELSHSRKETRRIAAKKILYQKAMSSFDLYMEKIENEQLKHHDDLLNPGMFEEGDFLRIQIGYYKNMTQIRISEQEEMAQLM